MENDLQSQIKGVIDTIQYLQYMISVTTCIRERYYYHELLSHYYYAYHQLSALASKNKEIEENPNE